MTQVILFHSALGVRAGITELAEALRAAGHQVEVVDQYDGQVFDSYDDAMAHVEGTGMPALMASALAGAEGVSGPFVAVGFSNGAGMAQWVAANRPEEARGVVMAGGAMSMEWFDKDWPSGVPGQIHHTEADPFVDEGSDDAVQGQAREADAEVELFVYPGAGHLFSDPTWTDEYDAGSAALFTERVVAFVDAVG
jgi:dienelactone hydrolase